MSIAGRIFAVTSMTLLCGTLSPAVLAAPTVPGAIVTPTPQPAGSPLLPSPAPRASAQPVPSPIASIAPVPQASKAAATMPLPVPAPLAAAAPLMPLMLDPTAALLPVVTADDTAPADGIVLVEQRAASLISGATLSVAAGTDRERQDESGVAALVSEVILQTPVMLDGARLPLLDAVALRGGTIAVNLTGDHIFYTIQTRSTRLSEMLDILRQAVTAPAFDAVHVERARTRLLGQIAAQAQNPIAVGTQIFRSGKYRDSTQAWPFLGTKAEVSVISRAQLREFFGRAYKRAGANLALVGNVSPGAAQAARQTIAALAEGQSSPVPLLGWKPFPPNSVVDASASVANPIFVLGYDAPSATSPDFGAMYVLMSLFQVGTGFDNITTAMNPIYRPIHVTYDYASSPANLAILMTSPGVSSETVARALLLWIEGLSTRPMDAQSLNEAKNLAIGRFLTENFEPDAESRRLSTLDALGMGINGANEIVRRIREVTPLDVLRVAAAYCSKPTYARIGPRSESAP